MDSAALLRAIQDAMRANPARADEVGDCRKCGKRTIRGPAFAAELAVNFLADIRVRPSHSCSEQPLRFVLERLVGICGDCGEIDEVLMEAVSTFVREVRNG